MGLHSPQDGPTWQRDGLAKIHQHRPQLRRQNHRNNNNHNNHNHNRPNHNYNHNHNHNNDNHNNNNNPPLCLGPWPAVGRKPLITFGYQPKASGKGTCAWPAPVFMRLTPDSRAPAYLGLGMCRAGSSLSLSLSLSLCLSPSLLSL